MKSRDFLSRCATKMGWVPFLRKSRRELVHNEYSIIMHSRFFSIKIQSDDVTEPTIKIKRARYTVRTIHLTPNGTVYALTAALARDRLPCGTSNILLNAARSPAWHGSKPLIAQDQSVNTITRGADHTPTALGSDSTPAVADCRFKAPLAPRLVWSYSISCLHYIIAEYYLNFKYFLKF